MGVRGAAVVLPGRLGRRGRGVAGAVGGEAFFETLSGRDQEGAGALLQFFLVNRAAWDGGWTALLEERLCGKTLFGRGQPKAGPTDVIKSSEYLFSYTSKATCEDQAAGMLHVLHILYQHHNTGLGHAYMSKQKNKTVQDTCTGVTALFAPRRGRVLLWAGVRGTRAPSRATARS